MKKLALFLAAVMLLTCCLCFTASAQNGIKVSVVDAEANLGEDVAVTVAFSDNTGFNTIGVRIVYPAGFTYKADSAAASDLIKDACYLDFGGYSGATYIFNVDETNRTITMVAASLDDITAASGDLFTATFTAPNAETEATFTVEILDSAYNDKGEIVEIDKINGTVTVAEGVKYARGDINLDGNVNSLDAMLAMQSFVGMTELTNLQKTLGDVVGNGDGVNSLDAMAIMQFFVGMIVEL